MGLKKKIIEYIREKRYIIKLFFYFCIMGVAVLAVSPCSPPGIEKIWDKANHILAFMVLSFLAFTAYLSSVTRISLILMSYGVFIEVVQFFLTYREFSFKDMAADLVGILFGLGFFMLSGIRKKI